MTDHTPGPWSIEERSIVNRNHGGADWDICTVHSCEANARLIAAAPEMLEALREWVCPSCGGTGRYHQNRVGSKRNIERGRPLDPHFNPEAVTCKICGGNGLHPRASAAIAKATGKSTEPAQRAEA